MTQTQCPSCGAEIKFRTSISLFMVCGFCRSTLIRNDGNLENLGKMAELPEDLSPIQVGSCGTYEKRKFEILGRLKISWAEGTWNEWFAYFGGHQEGWLAEGQGFFMMSFLNPEVKNLGPAFSKKALRVGNTLHLPTGEQFEIDDIKETTCIGSEGELPFSAPKGRKSTCVDLSGDGKMYGCLDLSEDGGLRTYIGRYVEIEDLQISNLRKIEGW